MPYNMNPYLDDYCEIEDPCDCDHDHDSKCRRPRVQRRVVALEAISLTPQTVAAGAPVPFDTNLVVQGFGIVHNPGSPDFNLLAPGTYRVTFTGQVTTTGTNTTAGVALALNGVIIPGTAVFEVVVAGQATSLTTQALVQVPPYMNAVLTVVNPTGAPEIFTNPNIIIERIG